MYYVHFLYINDIVTISDVGNDFFSSRKYIKGDKKLWFGLYNDWRRLSRFKVEITKKRKILHQISFT